MNKLTFLIIDFKAIHNRHGFENRRDTAVKKYIYLPCVYSILICKVNIIK